MKCPKCGTENPDGAQICNACGYVFNNDITEEPHAKKKISRLAIASLVMGILSLLFFVLAAIPAIILGIVSLFKIKKSAGRLRGKGLAIAGIAVPSVSFVFLLPIMMAILMPAPVRTRTTADTASRFPDVRSVLSVIFEGEGILDSGKYSRDQQEQIFEQKYKGNVYFVHGEISDVGTTTFGKRKYITVEVTSGHYFDVFPTKDFDLLAYSKGQRVSFVGRWAALGTGIMFHHKIEDAVEWR